MIAVISDSHIPKRAKKIPEPFQETIEKAELTVHCGDFTEKRVKKQIQEKTKLIPVKGNCDFFELPNSQTFKYEETSFGVYHGTGIQPRGHLPTLVETAKKLDVKVLLTGHTHQQRTIKEDKKIILNPGSCTGVPGGSYDGGNPQMLEINIQDQQLTAKKITLKQREKAIDQKRFNLS